MVQQTQGGGHSWLPGAVQDYWAAGSGCFSMGPWTSLHGSTWVPGAVAGTQQAHAWAHDLC